MSLGTSPPPPTDEQIAARRRNVARAEEVRALRAVPDRLRLASAPLADLLLWGLSRENTGPVPVVPVLRAVRLELEVLSECIGADLQPHVFQDTLTGITRRLDVAIELLRRLRLDETVNVTGVNVIHYGPTEEDDP